MDIFAYVGTVKRELIVNVQFGGGLGHISSGGGGSRNLFGQAFAANGRTWNTNLCNADSDGDGFTNAEVSPDIRVVYYEAIYI